MKKLNKYDLIIIGGGISGTAIASALSAYNLSICVLEKSNDLSNGATKANSGIVHGGYDAEPGTLMARFNVRGNEMYPIICESLDVPFTPCGSYVIAFTDAEIKTLNELKERGELNGVPGLKILDRNEVLSQEPNLNPKVKAALFSKTAAVVSPYELCIAFMEHAMDYGAELKYEHEVIEIISKDSKFIVKTNKEDFEAKIVINAAGVYADKIHNMLLNPSFHIQPRRGEYFLMDKYIGDSVKHVIFQCPNEMGKGVLIAPTAHENLIVGPNAEDIQEAEAKETTLKGLKDVWNKALKTLPNLDKSMTITTFSGIRAQGSTGDFIVRDYPELPGFIDVAGIKSPGLTAAPAIAEYVVDLVKKQKPLSERKDFILIRRKQIRFSTLSHDEKAKLVKKDPKYGRIICRCEGVTEAEIVDVIHRNAGARTLDSVKRRTRSGGGRCQGGFCSPKIIEILSRELGIPQENIVKDSLASKIIIDQTKKDASDD